MTARGEHTTDQFSDDSVVSHYRGNVDQGLYTHEAAAVSFFGEPPARVLDLGCGAGRTTKLLDAAGFDVVGIDVSERMIESARELVAGPEFLVAEACQLPFDDVSFDHALFSYNGIDYIQTERRRERALREIRRVLRPGGYFAFSSHNARRVAGAKLFHPMYYFRTLQFWVENARAGTLGSRYKFSEGRRRYQIAPPHQRSQLREAGFTPVDTFTQFPFEPLAPIDPWPYYVARKPPRGTTGGDESVRETNSGDEPAHETNSGEDSAHVRTPGGESTSSIRTQE
ncbi:MAG: class I SAM-dependent methyltransferase [Haloferacaceae archaeon]